MPPIYQYQCKGCAFEFEELRPMEKREKTRCPECSKTARQVLTPVYGFVKNPAVPRRAK